MKLLKKEWQKNIVQFEGNNAKYSLCHWEYSLSFASGFSFPLLWNLFCSWKDNDFWQLVLSSPK